MVAKFLDLNKKYYEDHSSENVTQKATSHSLKIQRDYLNSHTLSIKYYKGRKRNLLLYVNMDDKTWN